MTLLDLEIDLPYEHRLEVETVNGPISLTGLIWGARLKTCSRWVGLPSLGGWSGLLHTRLLPSN